MLTAYVTVSFTAFTSSFPFGAADTRVFPPVYVWRPGGSSSTFSAATVQQELVFSPVMTMTIIAVSTAIAPSDMRTGTTSGSTNF